MVSFVSPVKKRCLCVPDTHAEKRGLETSLAYLVGRVSYFKKKVLWHKICVGCVNECMEKESSGRGPRPKINYFPPLR